MGRQRIIWLALGLAVVMALGLALWASRGRSRSSSPVDSATVQESVQTQLESPSGPPQAGGPTASGKVQEGLEYIIRDASGNVKESKSVGGK